MVIYIHYLQTYWALYAYIVFFPMFYKLLEAWSVWKLVGDLSHYPAIISVDVDVLVKVIMACIGILANVSLCVLVGEMTIWLVCILALCW